MRASVLGLALVPLASSCALRTTPVAENGCRTISFGAEARQLVQMEICGRLISGVSSTGRRIMLMMPKMAIRIPATATATGLPKESLVRVMSLLLPTFAGVQGSWANQAGRFLGAGKQCDASIVAA